jgi:Tfp pilus assembly protein FimT
MLIVVTLIGILSLLSAPRIERALAARSVSAAKTDVANLFLRVRTTAVTTRQTASLVVGAGSAFGTVTTPAGGVRFLSDPVQFDSLRVGVSATTTTITVQPTGLVTSGLPAVIRLSRGGVSDSLRITGYGRIQ